MVFDEKECLAKQFPKWDMIRNNDTTVSSGRRSIFLGKPDKILYVKGQDRSALMERVSQLISIRESSIPGLLGGNAIDPPVAKGLGQERIHIFIQI